MNFEDAIRQEIRSNPSGSFNRAKVLSDWFCCNSNNTWDKGCIRTRVIPDMDEYRRKTTVDLEPSFRRSRKLFMSIRHKKILNRRVSKWNRKDTFLDLVPPAMLDEQKIETRLKDPMMRALLDKLVIQERLEYMVMKDTIIWALDEAEKFRYVDEHLEELATDTNIRRLSPWDAKYSLMRQEIAHYTFYSICQYSAMCDFPEDIKDDWREGIRETCNLILADEFFETRHWTTKDARLTLKEIRKLGYRVAKLISNAEWARKVLKRL
jgi:hypothetical protein